jgi:hypothetical protein
MRPEDVYYAGERDVDFGLMLGRAVNRMKVASPRGAGVEGTPAWWLRGEAA